MVKIKPKRLNLAQSEIIKFIILLIRKNICLNIGIGKNLSFVYKDDVNIFVPGNQRPVKTETNRRTATDEFTLVSDNTQVIVEYIKF